MMPCVNFDREFEKYLSAWMKEHAAEYRDVDAMEAVVPDVYETWLDTPAAWLSGAKPGEYFDQFTDAELLVSWMAQYFQERVPVPDMLLNRVAEMGLAAESPLMALLDKESSGADLRMTAVNLLREIDSIAPLQQYVAWQATRREGPDELCDNALDSLDAMGDRAVDAMRSALPAATPDGQEALLALLSNYPGDETVFQTALRLFQARRDRAAILAQCLGRLGDDRALPALTARADSEETPYLDYIELRNAIEQLGGDAPERVFDAVDPAYEALRGKQ